MGSRKIDNGKLDSLDRWYLRDGDKGSGGCESKVLMHKMHKYI